MLLESRASKLQLTSGSKESIASILSMNHIEEARLNNTIEMQKEYIRHLIDVGARAKMYIEFLEEANQEMVDELKILDN